MWIIGRGKTVKERISRERKAFVVEVQDLRVSAEDVYEALRKGGIKASVTLRAIEAVTE